MARKAAAKKESRRGPKGARSTEIRDRLVSNGIALFASRGFEGATFRELASLCGLAQSAPFYHFADKSELFMAVLEEIVRRNHEWVGQACEGIDLGLGALERIQAHMRANVEWALLHPAEGKLLVLLYHLATFDEAASARYGGMLEVARGRIAALVAAGQRERIFDAGIDPRQAGALLHDLLVGSYVNLVSTTRSLAKKEVAAAVTRLARSWELAFRALER